MNEKKNKTIVGGFHGPGIDMMSTTSAHLPLARTQLCAHTCAGQAKSCSLVVCPEGKEMSFGKYVHHFAIASKWKTQDLNLGILASETCS